MGVKTNPSKCQKSSICVQSGHNGTPLHPTTPLCPCEVNISWHSYNYQLLNKILGVLSKHLPTSGNAKSRFCMKKGRVGGLPVQLFQQGSENRAQGPGPRIQDSSIIQQRQQSWLGLI
ncbi:predicted protein [Coccidioides posadasii str. Silveira]|uniref:Predicted protein n=1 Tax=Coccidioides posadasii (strain RMSCC 757 / Silveira) TaxID=443226 RepID=E9DDB0_COCPS|nr:predicted protein [Coccidioides posadasii str. Silveira]